MTGMTPRYSRTPWLSPAGYGGWTRGAVAEPAVDSHSAGVGLARKLELVIASGEEL